MNVSSLFAANKAVVISSIALSLYCLNGAAMSQPTPEGTDVTPLPGITVQAPKPRHHAVEPDIVSHRTSPTRHATSSVAHETSANPNEPILEKIARLGRNTSSCADGCQSSFPYGKDPWHGCNASGGVFSFTCRNVGNYKTYAECQDAGLTLGWRNQEFLYYCSSLALK